MFGQSKLFLVRPSVWKLELIFSILFFAVLSFIVAVKIVKYQIWITSALWPGIFHDEFSEFISWKNEVRLEFGFRQFVQVIHLVGRIGRRRENKAIPFRKIGPVTKTQHSSPKSVFFKSLYEGRFDFNFYAVFMRLQMFGLSGFHSNPLF